MLTILELSYSLLVLVKTRVILTGAISVSILVMDWYVQVNFAFDLSYLVHYHSNSPVSGFRMYAMAT